MMNILLVDDHSIVRRGLKQIIADEIADAHFGEAHDAAHALALLHGGMWDAMVLDVNMPGRDGFEVLAEVRQNFPRLPVLVLSSTPEDQLGLRAMRAGASGYLNKQVAPEKLVDALRTLLGGGQFISPSLAQKLVSDLRRGTDRPLHDALSDRELQVCRMTATGKSLKEIAAELHLSPKTVSTFRGRAFEKLAVRNDVELVHYARDHGLM